MNIHDINSKIVARTCALAKAVELHGSIYKGGNIPGGDCLELAKKFEDYLIGNAELPEIAEDPTKSWVNTLNELYSEQVKRNKEEMDKTWGELMDSLPKLGTIDNSKVN